MSWRVTGLDALGESTWVSPPADASTAAVSAATAFCSSFESSLSRPGLQTGRLRDFSRRTRACHDATLPSTTGPAVPSLRANNASGVLREKRGSPLAGEKAFSPIGGAWLGSGESVAAWAAPHALATAAAIVPGGDSGATK